MNDKQLLMIPGPTPVPERVLHAMAKHPIGHRSSGFADIQAALNEQLKWLHQTTQSEVLSLTGSGTAAMEAGIINFLRRGDRVLCGRNGKFGERWAEVSSAYGLQVDCIDAEWGKPLDPAAFQAALAADTDKQIKAVILTHSETSTGVLNDLPAINAAVKAHGEALIIVDAVTSLGACSVPVDEWGLDVVASGSQKGYMIPPGMGFVCVSPKAWAAYKTADLPRYYLDLGKYRKAAEKASTPFTPAVNLTFALQEAFKMMQAEGLEAMFARHDRLRRATRAAIAALGLNLLGADACASPAVTAVLPAQVDAEAIRGAMRKDFDIALAGGQDHLKGKLFRIGHLGFVCERDILSAIGALEATLQGLGVEGVTPGAGIAAAASVFQTV